MEKLYTNTVVIGAGVVGLAIAKVISARNSEIIISAGPAGTGKTFALAHLVLRLLTEKEHPIKQLLVVTFTDASAAELRARISSRLEAALKGLEALENVSKKEAPDEILQQWLDSQSQDQTNKYKLDCTRRVEWSGSLKCQNKYLLYGL